LRPLHYLEILGTGYPAMYHIAEEWKPQLYHCKNSKTYRSSMELSCNVQKII